MQVSQQEFGVRLTGCGSTMRQLDFQDPGTGAHIGIHFIQGPITGSEEKWVLAELSGLLEIPPAKEINAASKRIPPTDCTHRLTEQLQM